MVLEPKEAQPLIEELMAWYQVQAFPMYQPEETIATSVANSTLCHVSVTKWCMITGENSGSDMKKKRCGGLTADVTGKVVEMLNKHYAQTFVREHKPSEIVDNCKACHGKEPIHVTGKEDCMNCHTEDYLTFPHPVKE